MASKMYAGKKCLVGLEWGCSWWVFAQKVSDKMGHSESLFFLNKDEKNGHHVTSWGWSMHLSSGALIDPRTFVRPYYYIALKATINIGVNRSETGSHSSCARGYILHGWLVCACRRCKDVIRDVSETSHGHADDSQL